MIEIYSSGARYTVEKLKQFSLSPFGLFLYAVTVSVFGILILLMFMATFVQTAALPMAVPVVVGFNAALCGFNLSNRATVEVPCKNLQLFLLASCLCLTGCFVITLFCPWESFLDGRRIAISGLAALSLTYLGSWIAIKSKNINRSN